jgi:TorA maturation chaperone TorD
MAPEHLPGELAAVFAEDLRTLAALQDRELDAEAIAALRAVGFPGSLGLIAADEPMRRAFGLLAQALEQLPEAAGRAELDALAADYAAIYLTGALGASPCESVWLSEDHLTCQEPMFEVRRVYAEHDLQAADWRARPDDHLVLQLQFLASLFEAGGAIAQVRESARFLDEHLLRWIGDFAQRVASRCDTAFYAGLALLSAAYCDSLRDILARWLGEPRPSPEEIAERFQSGRTEPAVPVRFVPGTGW